MKIAGGRHRGRALAAPATGVRPTAARTREALFNILAHGGLTPDGSSAVVDAVVLDAFAGSGALGLEALSRGAAHVVFWDTDRAALAAILAALDTLGETARAEVALADATRPPPARRPCTLALLDPPYDSGLAAPALAALAGAGWLAPGALVAVESRAKDGPFAPPPGFEALDDRTYGAARLTLLRWEGAEA